MECMVLNQSDAQTEDGHAMMKFDTFHSFRNCRKKAGDADLWITICEELHLLVKKWWKWRMLRRTAQRKKKHMSQFERFVTAMQQERGGVCALRYVASLTMEGL